MEGRSGGRKRRSHAWPEMASPMPPYSSASARSGLPRRGSGAVPLVVVRVFLHVPECHLEPLLRTARSSGRRSSHHTATPPPVRGRPTSLSYLRFFFLPHLTRLSLLLHVQHIHLSTSFSLPRKTAHPHFFDAMGEQGGMVCVMGMEDQGRLRRTDKGKAQRGQIPSDLMAARICVELEEAVGFDLTPRSMMDS